MQHRHCHAGEASDIGIYDTAAVNAAPTAVGSTAARVKAKRKEVADGELILHAMADSVREVHLSVDR